MNHITSMMPSRRNEIREAIIALHGEEPLTRRARLIAARQHGRSGCNRLFTLRGHYDKGSYVLRDKGEYAN